MNKPFYWDVFLSHSSIDKPRVARLAERLTAAGFRVWFDRPNIDSREDIVTAVEQGLERSRVLVLCMTKAAFESEWVRLERNKAVFHDPGGSPAANAPKGGSIRQFIAQARAAKQRRQILTPPPIGTGHSFVSRLWLPRSLLRNRE